MGYDRREINEISNIAFLNYLTSIRKSNRQPDKHLEEVVRECGSGALEEQLIPLHKSLWSIQNYKHFIDHRRKAIATYINVFLIKLEIDNNTLTHERNIKYDTPYEILKNLENSLRITVEKNMSKLSPNWWLERVPYDVRLNTEDRKRRNEKLWPWFEEDSSSNLSYLDFSDYMKIIRRTDNWNDVFKQIYVDRELLDSKFRELNPIRNKIAHNRDLTENDKVRLSLLADDILKCLIIIYESLSPWKTFRSLYLRTRISLECLTSPVLLNSHYR